MAARQTVQYTHKHANASTRKTQKDLKKQQSTKLSADRRDGEKAVGTVKGRETSG